MAALTGLALLAGLAGSARLSPAGVMWGLGEAVSLAAYFLLSAAAGDQVLPPLVMAWAGLGTGAAVRAVAGWTGALRITASVDHSSCRCVMPVPPSQMFAYSSRR